ncbi:MAG TPA: FxSxx-COOH system tetratricopeptide repeat protein, partial [Methanothrix sp.]|nr:FxSxx-COOH system tetratricopeptide repeat protein [Methanothrix sp.]
FQRNRNFEGREDVLADLAIKFKSEDAGSWRQALYGTGGVGKTQIAIEYAYRHKADFKVIWWLRSDAPVVLANDLASLAASINLPEKDSSDQTVITAAVKRWLEHNPGWLLIFDNAQEPQDLKDFLPRGDTGRILITSLNPSWSSMAKPIHIQPLRRDESVKFLCKRTGQEDPGGADGLADDLGDLPLALEQAGAYIEETGISFMDYRSRFEKHRKTILERGKPIDYPYTVATTWEISREAAKERSAASADLLNLCSFLASDAIPRSLLVVGRGHLPESLAALDELEFDDAVLALRRFSLADVTEDSLYFHRLAQAVTRDRLDEKEQKRWAGSAVKLLNGVFPEDHIDNVQSWDECSILLPHAMAAAEHAEELGVEQEATGRLLNESGLYLRTLGQFVATRSALERALKIGEATYGPDHPIVAIRVNNLGSVLKDLGDLHQARECFERALKIDEATYGPDHPGVATMANNLGRVLQDLGDLHQARECFERALKID